MATVLSSTPTLLQSPYMALPTPGTRGRIAYVTDKNRGFYRDTGKHWSPFDAGEFNVTDFDIVGDDATDNSDNLNAMINLVPLGATIVFPAGNYKFSKPWILDNLYNIRIVGQGSNGDFGRTATRLLFIGTGSASAISMRSCVALSIEHLAIYWSQTGFIGYLLDYSSSTASNTSNCSLNDVNLRPTVDSTDGCLGLVNFSFGYNFSAHRCLFRGAQYNIVGRTTSLPQFNNTVNFHECNFSHATQCGVKGIHETWEFDSCVFEPLKNGAAGALTYDSGLPYYDVTFKNCWMGDDNSSENGVWITCGACRNLTVEGCAIGCNSNTTGILVNDNGAQVIDVRSTFNGGGGNSKAIDFGTSSGHSGFICLSSYPGITNDIAGTIPAGSIHNAGGGLTLVSPTISGNVSATSVTTTSLTVSGASLTPNVLSSVDADFETGAGHWVSNFHAINIANTNAAFLHGSHCLSASHDATHSTDLSYAIASYGASAPYPGLVAVSVGDSWTALAEFLCPVGSTPRLIQLDIYGCTNTSLGGFTRLATSGATSRDNTSSWTPLKVSATIPSGISYISIVITWLDTGSNYIAFNETHYVDCVSLSKSTSSTWQDPAAGAATITLTDGAFSIANSAGTIVASIDDNGNAAFNTIKIGGNAIGFGSGTPTVGTWNLGDIFWNSIVASGQPEGWRCVTAGTPGTWSAMALHPD